MRAAAIHTTPDQITPLPGDGLSITDEESAEQFRAIDAERDARKATDALLGSVTP